MEIYRIEVKETSHGPILATLESWGGKVAITTPGITFPQFRSILIEALYNLDDCIQDEEAQNIAAQQMLDRDKRRREEMVEGLFNRSYKKELASMCYTFLQHLTSEALASGKECASTGVLRSEGTRRSAIYLYAKLSEVFSPVVRGEQKLLERIAIISHEGGLENLSESDALTGIRKLVLPYWQNGKRRKR